jgi:3-oxosteroid 1-dehydrogenase
MVPPQPGGVHPEPPVPARADVVVGGSGAAGLTAALAAATEGADVLLVERAGQLGGISALSGGRVWIPASDLSGGDTPAAAAAYLDGISATATGR